MHKKNDLDLYYRKKRSIDFSDSKDSSTCLSHLHGFDVKIGSKRIRWFPPRIPEHPNVLISKDTARNKACQTIDVRHRHIPEAYMQPCEYILTTGKKYKRMITWIDLTNVHTNDKNTQTTNKTTVTEHHKINAEPDKNIHMFSSSQLLDYDEDTKPNETEQTRTKTVVDSEGFSHILEKENMRMVQLLGHLCRGGGGGGVGDDDDDDDDGGEILGGTGYGRWGRVCLFSKSTPSYDTDITQNCSPF